MFSNISWQQYWTSVVVITLAYYLVIYLLYFRKGFALLFPSGLHEYNSPLKEKEESRPSLFENDSLGFKQMTENNEEHIAYACMDELNAFFENQKSSKAVKSEVMYALYGILQKYPSLRNCDYKESITNVIALQCENICSIHLSAEELKGVWFG
jgi:hypothetical protein